MERKQPVAVGNQPTTHPQYRQIALAIYIGVLIIGLIDWMLGSPPSYALPFDPVIRFITFFLTVAALIVLEIWRPSSPSNTSNQAIVHLISKIVLSSLAMGVGNQFYTQLLFLIAILFAEITFSRRISLITIGITFVVLFLRLAFGPRGDFISLSDLQGLLIFAVAIIMIMLMGRLIKQEWSNRLNLQTLHDELKVSHRQLQQNSAQLAELAVANERNRLARDIHDSLGHHLTAVSIQLEMAIKLHDRAPTQSLAAMQEAKNAAQEALQDVRQSVGALRQPSEQFDLMPAVELIIGRMKSDQLAITYRLDGDESNCPQSTRLALYRAVQEGLTNIHKHAAASHVNLWLQFSPRQARLRIIDDGIGFDLQQKTYGVGLKGVRERIAALGGKVTVDSRPTEGTVLDINIPLAYS
ncbi:MAG: sensor histidine kinase [Chloroflexota bacterium]